MDKKNETVTISKEEYDSLVEDSLFLECLQGADIVTGKQIGRAHV